MIGLFNSFIRGLGVILQAVLSILPASPFQYFQGAFDSGVLGLLNYFLPIDSAIAHLQAFVFAVAVWFGLRIVMRWLKAAAS